MHHPLLYRPFISLVGKLKRIKFVFNKRENLDFLKVFHYKRSEFLNLERLGVKSDFSKPEKKVVKVSDFYQFHLDCFVSLQWLIAAMDLMPCQTDLRSPFTCWFSVLFLYLLLALAISVPTSLDAAFLS